jgi:hypothetical protein
LLARVKETLVPEIVTELMVLTAEFTRTLKAEFKVAVFERLKLYVISRIFGVAFCTTELTYTGEAIEFTLFVTV